MGWRWGCVCLKDCAREDMAVRLQMQFRDYPLIVHGDKGLLFDHCYALAEGHLLVYKTHKKVLSTPINPVLRRLKQADDEFKVSLITQ